MTNLLRNSLAAWLLLLLHTSPGLAGSISIAGIGGTFDISVMSMKEIRFKSVIKQKYDFSCGSAALATLLSHHYEHSITEQEIFEAMWEKGNKEQIKKNGFSLLDMKKYLKSIGYRADGFRVPLEKLRSTGIPAIALINTNGYMHFVVVKGVNDKEVFIGDPATGLRVLSRKKFESEWNGLLFAIRNKINVGRQYFNEEPGWVVRTKAPFSTAINRSGLTGFTLSLPRRSDL